MEALIWWLEEETHVREVVGSNPGTLHSRCYHVYSLHHVYLFIHFIGVLNSRK